MELWGDYFTAFDILEARLVEEDGDDRELETVTGVFGEVEKGYRKALGSLTDAIEKKAQINAEAATVKQERVNEAERQQVVRKKQLEEARQVLVFKEQIKTMYNEAIDAIQKTAELIKTMEEPSLPVINAPEQELRLEVHSWDLGESRGEN